MNRNRMLLWLGVALIVALAASTYVYRQFQQAQANKVVKQVHVVVTAVPLKVGQPLTATDLALLDWPEGREPIGSFSRTEDCVGRVPLVPVTQGEVVLNQLLAKPEAGTGLSVTIPEGMRAVSVGVDEVVAVAGFVTPGTIVDVLVTGTGPGGPVTRTILERVRILAVGQELQTVGGKPQMAPVITLLVNPADGEKLTLAAAEGKIHLALRNTVDAAEVNPPPIYGSSIFPGMVPRVAAPRPVAPKPAPVEVPYTVQVIRGDKIENQSFPR